ncbi:MAG: CBS domain-containing protein, partial [Lentisphaeria bacterium]|nr:CBS domain-containing protein [Lentisphaeria bacterium]
EIALIIALAYVIQVQSAAWYVKFTDRIFGPAPEAKVRDVMLEGVFALHLSDTFQQAIKLLAEEHIHSVAVLDADNKPVGMISTNNVIDAMADGAPYDQPLSSMQLEPVLISSARTPLKTVLAEMKRIHEYKALVLDDQGRVSYVVPHDEIMLRLATES